MEATAWTLGNSLMGLNGRTPLVVYASFPSRFGLGYMEPTGEDTLAASTKHKQIGKEVPSVVNSRGRKEAKRLGWT